MTLYNTNKPEEQKMHLLFNFQKDYQGDIDELKSIKKQIKMSALILSFNLILIQCNDVMIDTHGSVMMHL